MKTILILSIVLLGTTSFAKTLNCIRGDKYSTEVLLIIDEKGSEQTGHAGVEADFNEYNCFKSTSSVLSNKNNLNLICISDIYNYKLVSLNTATYEGTISEKKYGDSSLKCK